MPRQYRYSILPGGRRVLDLRVEADDEGEDVPAPAAPAAPAVDVDAPIAAILADVGTDAGRARAALEAENRKDKPRRTLTDKLEAML